MLITEREGHVYFDLGANGATKHAAKSRLLWFWRK
jgi:hypothetical protein